MVFVDVGSQTSGKMGVGFLVIGYTVRLTFTVPELQGLCQESVTTRPVNHLFRGSKDGNDPIESPPKIRQTLSRDPSYSRSMVGTID